MPQINSGKSPSWVSGEIVTAAGLNGMIDAATLDPSAVTAQSDFPTLTGNEYALIVDPVSGQLKKTQLKNSLLTGNDIEVDNILGKINNGILLIRSTGSASTLRLEADVGGLGTIIANCTNLNLNATNAFANNGFVAVSSGTGGMSLTSAGNLNFTASHPAFVSTGAVQLPVGTTAQRPATPLAGDLRFNTTTSNTEFYNGSAWESSDPISAVSLTTNGYVKLTNGLTMQWGRTNVVVGTYGAREEVFPIAFTTACLNLQITLKLPQDNYTANGYAYENSVKVNGTPTTTGFGYSVHYGGGQGQASYAYWFAIGY